MISSSSLKQNLKVVEFYMVGHDFLMEDL